MSSFKFFYHLYIDYITNHNQEIYLFKKSYPKLNIVYEYYNIYIYIYILKIFFKNKIFPFQHLRLKNNIKKKKKSKIFMFAYHKKIYEQ